MAQLTRLSVDEARAIVGAYGRPLERIDALPAQGTINSNFRVRAAGADYFLRVNEGKADADVLAEAELVARLRAGGLPTPEVLRTVEGRWFARAGDKPVTLFPWVAGREAEGAAQAGVAGRALGMLHRAGAGLGAGELPRDHYHLDELQRRLDGFAADPRFAAVVPSLARELERARWRRGDGGVAGLIHQDLFPDNLLVDAAGELAAVLDLEQATHGPLVYDLAVCLNAWCWDGAQIDTGAAQALRAGYEAERPLGADEARALPAEAALAAARFTITRITDVCLRDDVDEDLRRRKDWREYARRLAYWEQAA